MLTDLEQLWVNLLNAFQTMGVVRGAVFALLFLVIWFLPALLALIFNRQHAGKIFLACVPAIASWIAWFALLGWAVTGRVWKGQDKGAAAPQSESEGTTRA